MSHPDDSHADPFVGRDVGNYAIEDRLGAGGMGVVYRAVHRTLGRQAALKALPLERTADAERRERFVQEARAASALDHPGIVAIYDVITEDDRDFLVMEYLEGKTLDELIMPGGMAAARSVEYAHQIADALDAAHQRGIVHRDIKPSNVMVTSAGRLKVLDFGLAKLIEPDISDDEAATRLTRDGSVIGTADYMSPEQALGEEIDGRSDIFSLGVVLYEMCCGERPFRGENWVEVVHAICSLEPPPVSSLNGAAPPGIDAVLERALAKNREHRFPTMGAMIEALSELAAGLPDFDPASVQTGARTVVRPSGSKSSRASGSPVASPDSSGMADASAPQATGSPAEARSRWGSGIVFAAAIAAVALGLALLAPTMRWWRGEAGEATESASAASTPFEHFERGVQLLERSYRAGNVDNAITAFESALAQDREYAPAHAGLSAALRTQYRTSNRDPVILTRAVESARQAVARDPYLALGHRTLALALIEQGELDDASTAVEEAARLDPGTAEIAFARGRLAEALGEVDTAIDRYGEAIERGPDSWRYHNALGSLYFAASRYEDSADEFRAVTDLTPDNATGFQSLGAILHMLGRVEEAAGALQTALQVQPDAITYSNLGTLFYFEGRYSEAARAFDRAVEMEPNEYTFWVNLGDAYRWVPGRESDAEDAFTRAIQLMRTVVERGEPSLYLRTMLAESLAKRSRPGDVEEALAMLFELEADVGDDADSRFSMAKAYEIAGDREAALTAIEDALEGGYSTQEVANEPELTDLRNDVRYHRLALRYQ